MSELVDDILDSERLVSGEMTLDREVLDPDALVGEALTEIAPFADRFEVRFEKRATGPLPAIEADWGRLLQVLSNLFSNAAKFSDPGATVTVGLEAAERELHLTVTDRGAGIPEEAQATIFDRFTQAHRGHGRNARSTGLGLNIARQIVEFHGGRLDFTSAEGMGTTFRVCLPASVERSGTSLEATG